jgi:hypothetical protein
MPWPYSGTYSGAGSTYKTPTNTSWGWNQSNPFGTSYQRTAPAMGSTYQAPQTGIYLQAPKPAMGESFTPAPGMDVPTPQPFGQNTINTQTGNAYTNGGLVGNVNPPNQDVLTPQPQFNAPPQVGGYNPSAFQTQYGTFDNIQDYVNPFAQAIVDKGNQNIMAQASARGLLGSTGTANQLGDWASQVWADQYEKGFNRHGYDREYMTDVYRDNRDYSSDNLWKTNAFNYGMYGDAKNDWRTDMQNWYNAMNGINNTGINASNQAGAIQTLLGSNLAGLFGNQGDVGAMSAIQQGNNNTGLISGLLGALFGGMR